MNELPPPARFGRVASRALSAYPLELHEYVGHNYFTSPLINFD